MIKGVSEEVKENNRLFTEECRAIFNGLKFAEIKKRRLMSGIIPIVLTIFWVMLVGITVYIAYAVVSGKIALDWGTVVIFVITVLFTCVMVGVCVVYSLNYTGKIRSVYFVRAENADYKIYCEENNGVKTVSTIVNLTAHRVIHSEEDGKCSVDNSSTEAEEVTGFKQFLASPDKIFGQSISSDRYRKNRYKRKKTILNKTYIYFPAFDNTVFGARFARSITLENGEVKSVCIQVITDVAGDRVSALTYKYDYFHVNDSAVKLNIPPNICEQAKEVGFELPENSPNIICA